MEDRDIKVTVVVPVYNVEAYLAECLDSLIGQTLREIEIVCVDDGSTDGSGRLCDEYAARDSRIRVIHKPNGGLSSARNAGFDAATGTYIYFCDSDDYIDRDALALLYACALEHDLDMLHFGVQSFGEGKGQAQRALKRFWNELAFPALGPCTGEALLGQMGASHASITQSYLYRAAFLRENGFAFYEGIVYEDSLYILETLLRAQRAQAIPERLFHYRIRSDSIMTKRRGAHEYLSSARVAVVLMQLAQTTEDPAAREAIARHIKSCVHSCGMIYEQCGKAEREKMVFETDSPLERMLYEYGVACPVKLYVSRTSRIGRAVLYPAVKMRGLWRRMTRR